MSLGSNISRLRTSQSLSQDGLAERLGVSRQSVSKWETDASVPELDKLVRLAALFEITLDELVTGQPPTPPAAPPTPAPVVVQPAPFVVRQEGLKVRQIVGILLVSTGLVLLAMLVLRGDLLAALLFSAPFWLCGTVLLVFHGRSGLWCGWALLLVVEVFLYYATGTRWSSLLTLLWFPRQAQEMLAANRFQFIFASLLLLWRVVMVLLTVRSWRQLRLPRGGRPLAVTLGGAAVWMAVRAADFLFNTILVPKNPFLYLSSYWYRAASQVLDYAYLAGFIWLLVRGAAHWRGAVDGLSPEGNAGSADGA